MRTIIIPDIHGRNYWKSIVEKAGDAEYIFLGDYLDRYPGQKNNDGTIINNKSALENFKEILEFKRNNLAKVTLLLGNHDLEYFVKYMVPCRQDESNLEEIKRLFLDNSHLFEIGKHLGVDGRCVTFTHANITRNWICSILTDQITKDYVKEFLFPEDNTLSIKEMCLKANNTDIIDMLNRCLHNYNYDMLGELLHHIGRSRGGDYFTGSPVWCDFFEVDCLMQQVDWRKEEIPDLNEDYYQVVGHTQHIIKEPELLTASENSVCLDCHVGKMDNRVAFELVPFYLLYEYKDENIYTCVKILE